MKFYPDVNIKNLSHEFISYVKEVIENLLENKIAKEDANLILKEAV